MSVLKYFKNTPRSPPIGRQGLSVIFFSNSQGGPWSKKMAGGPVARWGGAQRQCPSSLYKPWPRVPSHLSLKIQKKKRGEEKKSGEALPNSALVIYR